MRFTSARRAALALGLVAGLVATAPAQAQTAAPGELIVRFARGADAGERAQIRDRAGVDLDSRLSVRGVDLQLVEAEPGQSAGAAERALEQADGVVYAEPNFYRRASLRPTDPSFQFQWDFENTGQSGGLPGADVNAVSAWDLTTGSPGTVVAVVDSGVSLTHPDLAGSGWTNPGETGAGRETNRVDDDSDGLIDDSRGWDWVANDPDPTDLNGHGTHVAGTVGARAQNGQGIAGTSWNARLMPLRVLGSDGSGTVANVIRGYRYAAAHGARIVNVSLGASSASLAERDAIAAAPGVLFVVAAGNGGADGRGDDAARSPEYPCAYPLANILCVASTGRRDLLSSFSNYGAASVDLAAPGEGILSTWLTGRYRTLSGTSMATPHVAGAAALLLARRPGLSVSGLRAALLGGVDPLPSLAGRVASGGRLDLRRSLELAAPTAVAVVPAPPPAAPAPARAPAPAPVAPAPPADRTAPRLSLRVRRKLALRRVLKRGLPVTVSCSAPCSVRLRILLTRRQARRAHLARKGRMVSIGTRTLRDTARRKVRLRVTRRARVRLARLGSAKVTVRARGVDPAGNARVVRRRVTLTG
jgi:subtilisin family serine protease